MATRYKLSKEQLERVVENFVMEAASAKAPVKNHIPSQGSEAKKHVKNKISGKIVDQSEGMPSITPMKKKLSHAPESKKFVSNSKMTHSNKAKVVKEEKQILDESIMDIMNALYDFIQNIDMNQNISIGDGGEAISIKEFMGGVLAALGVTGAALVLAFGKPSDKGKVAGEKFVNKVGKGTGAINKMKEFIKSKLGK